MHASRKWKPQGESAKSESSGLATSGNTNSEVTIKFHRNSGVRGRSELELQGEGLHGDDVGEPRRVHGEQGLSPDFLCGHKDSPCEDPRVSSFKPKPAPSPVHRVECVRDGLQLIATILARWSQDFFYS